MFYCDVGVARARHDGRAPLAQDHLRRRHLAQGLLGDEIYP